MITIVNNTKYIIFLFFFVIFFFEDIRKNSVNNNIFVAYFMIGIIFIVFNIYNQYILINEFDYGYIIEIILSITLGLMIYMISIITKEAIGKGDAIYFIVNSFYISFVENISLFMIGILVSTIISILLYIKNKGKVKNIVIPFIPCLMPVILWRILCML